ncbi:hypothetical protein BBJ28_00004482 [Nothophytophthora sp. Chile5]|nr:hypothetical protein BBJ28_00004482 [Nothophytophthora sp. Chile5]
MPRSPRAREADVLRESDVHERLLPARERRASREATALEETDDDDAFTHEELLHSVGSFSAVVWPVAILIGYMMVSSAMLLGMLGGNMLAIVIAQLQVPVDVFSLLFAMFNFSVVGVIAIFYQKGMPMWLTQAYLVATSVIMAWQLGQFPEWSTWALVIVLAFYDLCAVLTPCGPLKWLVNLVQQEGRPLPGLLYEAEIRRDHSTGREAPPVHENVYYQCESEIPLRLGSPRQAPVAANSPALSPREAHLRVRLIEFYTKHNPSAIARVDKILERYRGQEAALWHDLHQKYITEEGDVDETIKLGLGDFVFYSVLVSRAAKYDFSAMIGCLVSILMVRAPSEKCNRLSCTEP